MRTALFCAVAPLALLAAGCFHKTSSFKLTGVTHSAQLSGLEVTLAVPKREYRIGETFDVTVVARNTTDQPIQIDATSSALVYLSLYRYNGLSWQQIQRFPEAATMVMSPWTLAPHSGRKFTMALTVGPDWPTDELLRLAAELNGRPEVSPGVVIKIKSPGSTSGQQ